MGAGTTSRYDFFADRPHQDRFGRRYSTWIYKRGDSNVNFRHRALLGAGAEEGGRAAADSGVVAMGGGGGQGQGLAAAAAAAGGGAGTEAGEGFFGLPRRQLLVGGSYEEQVAEEAATAAEAAFMRDYMQRVEAQAML